MKLKKSLLFTPVLIVPAVFIHIYSKYSTAVENQYSIGIYPVISRFLRYLFGWLPFSIGDVLYGLIILWMLWKIVAGVKAIFKKKPPLEHPSFSYRGTPKGEKTDKIGAKFIKRLSLQGFVTGLFKTIRILLFIYLFFNAFWGINYNRVGIAGQLQLKMDKYSLDDLKIINELLVTKNKYCKTSPCK